MNDDEIYEVATDSAFKAQQAWEEAGGRRLSHEEVEELEDLLHTFFLRVDAKGE